MFQYGFCDLNIDIEGASTNSIQSACRRLYLSGFRTVALNVTITEDKFKGKKKKGKNSGDTGPGLIPEPLSFDSEGFKGLNILNRLTAHISDPFQLHQLKQSQYFNMYHLFAVVPMNRNIFQQVCGLNDIDIISVLPESRAPFIVSKKLYDQALEKNIYFEITYSPAIIDTTCRKNVIVLAHQYYTVGKSKNVVITSGSTSPFNSIRGPYDVVHLGLVFGLNDVKTKETITKNCSELIFRAETRRKRKSFLSSLKLIHDAPIEHKCQNEDSGQPNKKMKLDVS